MERLDLINLINDASLDDNPQAVINELNQLFSDGTYKEYLDLVYEAITIFQLYGFLSYLNQEEKETFLETDCWRSATYGGKQLEYLNRGQLSVVQEMNDTDKIMLSAPTSFGKTTLIFEYILANRDKLNNIVFILPTNSLIEELYIKFLKYNAKYELGFNVSTQPGELGRTVFLLTPERFLIMCQTDRMAIGAVDLIVMDEMYKIRRDNDKTDEHFINNRSLRFRKVADILGEHGGKVFYLSPFTYNDTNSMNAFLEKYNIKKINRKTEYVSKGLICRYSEESGAIYKRAVMLLRDLEGEKNIVYVSDKSTALKIIRGYALLRQGAGYPMEGRLKEFYDHLNEQYGLSDFEWSVAEGLKYKIGLYVGSMPRYLKREVVNLFEEGAITNIIATTAFTEGVNCSARNLILTSVNTARSKELTQIDILNAIGRAGRFSKESMGYIYCIDQKSCELVSKYTHSDTCVLDNGNYLSSELTRPDYEIEMIDNRYLNEYERKRLKEIKAKQKLMQLSDQDIEASLSVPGWWKMALYSYLVENTTEDGIAKRKRLMKTIINNNDKHEVNAAISFFFGDMRSALTRDDMREDVFPHNWSEPPAFDGYGEFVWGKKLNGYVIGNPRKSIELEAERIEREINEIAQGTFYQSKKEAKPAFEAAGKDDLLKYMTKDFQIDFEKLYDDYFKFMSSIVQYKIPFYLTFYLSVFNLALRKKYPEKYFENELNPKDLMLVFEDHLNSNEFKSLYDYGIPALTIEKIQKNKMQKSELKAGYREIKDLDAYEKSMLRDYYELVKE